MVNCWRLPSGSPASTSGRWMMSMGIPLASGPTAEAVTGDRVGELLGVELDDELLAHGHVDLLAQREVAHGGLESPVATSSHIGTARSIVSRLWRSTIMFCGLRARSRRRRPCLTWYDGIVTRLPFTSTWPWRTNWRAWLRLAAKLGAEHDVVEAQLEHPQQVLAGDAAPGGWPPRRGCGTASRARRRCGGPSASRGAGACTRSRGCGPGRADPAGTACARSGTSSCRTSRP